MAEGSGKRPLQSPLRWAGSKRQLLPMLETLARRATFERYIEPFAGSARLFFAVGAGRPSILADFNEGLINALNQIKADPYAVNVLLQNWDATGEDYYLVRDDFNAGGAAPEQAARFIYLNRFGFNGVYRTNRKGQYNVPRGSRTGSLPDVDTLARVSVALQKTQILTRDFRHTIEMAGSGDLLYVDPPYTTTHRATYGEYGVGCFAAHDLPELTDSLINASLRGVKIILSFGHCPEIEDALPEWQIDRFESLRRISAKVETRSTKYSEIVATNFAHVC